MTFQTAARGFTGFLASLALMSSTAASGIEPTVTIQYQPNAIPQGATGEFVITISDTSGAGFTGGQINAPFVYAAGVVNSATPVLGNSCGGTLTADPGAASVQIVGVAVGNFSGCNVVIAVTTAATGVYSTTFPAGGFTATLNAGNGTFSNVAPSGPVTLTSVAPIVVINNLDSGPGSLRDAITALNSACVAGLPINFNIPGAGPHTIQLLSALPAITCDGAIVDGYSQPGAVANSDTGGGNNAVIEIALDGSAPACSGCDGLQIQASAGVIVRGLAIHSFQGSGILVGNGSADIMGNYIGTDPGGMSASGNAVAGVNTTGVHIELGGSSPGDRNLISANGVGVRVAGSATAHIVNNQIGGGRDGSAGNGNASQGILFTGVNASTSQIVNNLVRYNGAAGIVVDPSTTGKVIFSTNESYANSGIGIDIGPPGPSTNGTAAVDYPVIRTVSHVGGDTIVTGDLQSGVNRPYVIELYHNSDPRSQTEGERLIDVFSGTLDGAGFGAFTRTISGFLADNVSAAATIDVCGDGCYVSSEYSPKAGLTDPLIVTTTSDAGLGSLRDAIGFVNSTCGTPKVIAFNIPGTGLRTITPANALPALTCAGTVIDGYSQPGASANSLAVGSNAVILVEIDGTLVPNGSGYGLDLQGAGDIVKGLAVTNFRNVGVVANANGVRVLGVYAGTPDGVVSKPNNYGVLVNGNNVRVGDGSPAGRNVLSGNGADGVRIQSTATDLIVGGNYIGVTAAGIAALKNGTGIGTDDAFGHPPQITGIRIVNNVISGAMPFGVGVRIWSNAGTGTVIQNNFIGTDATGTVAIPNATGIMISTSFPVTIGGVGLGNLVSGNIDGIVYQAAAGNEITTAGTVQGNFIGTNWTGAGPLGNSGFGVKVGGSGVAIGGVNSGEGNIIAFNGGSGVLVQNSAISILGNSIFRNGGPGIDLNAGNPPVDGIDSCDADGGANGWQNYPVITSATVSGGNISISGTFDSTINQTFRLEFFSSLASDNPSNNAGRTFIGSTPVATSLLPSCSTPFAVVFPYSGAIGDLITATATDPSNNTSWFSAAVAVAVAVAVTPPGAPTIGTATAGNGQATVSFAPPTSDGGAAITSYTVTSSPGGVTATGPASPITVLGLANGTAYTFTAVAANSMGPGPASAPSTPVTPLAPAGTPGGPTAVSVTAGNAQATVAFSPPASDGGSPITTYTATSSPGGLSASGVGSPITVTGLVNGTTYTFTVVATNSVGAGPASAPSNAVTPSAPAPTITLTPGSLTFATRPVSTTSPTQVVTLANNGPGSVAINSIITSGDFAFSSACGASVPSGGSCTIDVSFTPLLPGIRNGLVTISSNASGSPHAISLSGTGLATFAAVIGVSPTSDAFAAQESGTQSAPELFVIFNEGNAPLIFGDISVTGQGYTLLPTITGSTYTRCGFSIDPGAVCAVQVTFTPPAPGFFPGTLRITGNATNSPVVVSLSASGVITTPSRALSVPASLGFADQPVGTQSTGHALTITNNSASAVSLGDLFADGDFTVSDTCATIAGHGACAPLVFFQPSALGSRVGHVTIRALTEAQPYVVDLSGIGVVNPIPQISVSVARLGFGNTLMGVPVATQVLVHNVGQVPIAVGAIVASGDFFVAHDCGTTLAVGATCSLNVSFFPRVTGGRGGAVHIFTNAFGSPHEVQLSGVGCAMPSLARARSGQPLCGP